MIYSKEIWTWHSTIYFMLCWVRKSEIWIKRGSWFILCLNKKRGQSFLFFQDWVSTRIHEQFVKHVSFTTQTKCSQGENGKGFYLLSCTIAWRSLLEEKSIIYIVVLDSLFLSWLDLSYVFYYFCIHCITFYRQMWKWNGLFTCHVEVCELGS